MEPYVIRGGEKGYERLALLARTRWADTAALLARAGVSPGMRCVDMDEVKLDLARQAAAHAELTNVEFRQLSVQEWPEPAGYDVVYSRFLLQHQSDPIDLLGRMWAATRGGGVLIVEDADFDGEALNP